MAWPLKSRVGRYVLLGSCLLLFAVGIWQWRLVRASPLLLAPMMNLAPCLLAQSGASSDAPPDWLLRCVGPNASAAHLVEATLQELQPTAVDRAPWQLGYTLQVPLLAMLQPGDGAWQVNSRAVASISRTILDTQRPLVLYLFSTHFGVNAPIEPVLAGRCG